MAVPDAHDKDILLDNSQGVQGCGVPSDRADSGSRCRGMCDQVTNIDKSAFQDLQQRVLSLEMKALEQQMSMLESQTRAHAEFYPNYGFHTMPPYQVPGTSAPS